MIVIFNIIFILPFSRFGNLKKAVPDGLITNDPAFTGRGYYFQFLIAISG